MTKNLLHPLTEGEERPYLIKVHDERKKMLLIRQEGRKRNIEKRRVQALARKLKARQAASLAKAVARKEALAKLPRRFSLDDLGQGKKTWRRKGPCRSQDRDFGEASAEVTTAAT